MGISKTTAEFSGKLAKMATSAAKIPADTARHHIKTAERVMGSAVTNMAPSGRLSRVRSGKGATVGAKAFHKGGGIVGVAPRGPVWLVENPTEPHLIGAGRGRTTTRGGRSFVQGLSKSYNLDAGEPLNIPTGTDSWATGPVIHPGTRGKGQWARARDGAELPREIVADTSRAMNDAMREVFG